MARAEYLLVDEFEGVPAHSFVAYHVMTVLVLPLRLSLWTLLPGGQHGTVVCDGVVHTQEQHVLLTCRELEHLLTLFYHLGCGELFAARPLLVVFTRTPGIMKKNLCY